MTVPEDSTPPLASESLQRATELLPVEKIERGLHPIFGGTHIPEKAAIAMIAPFAAVDSAYAVNSDSFRELAVRGSLCSLLAAYVLYNAHNYRAGRNELIETTGQRHAELQGHFTEPIEADNRRIRWYGFDRGYHAEGFDPPSRASEFSKLVDAAHAVNNTDIVVSASIVDTISNAPGYAEFAKSATDSMTSVIDKKSDPVLLHLPLEQAARLRDELVAAGEGRQVSRAIELLETVSPSHPAVMAFDRYKFSSLTALEKALKDRIEQNASTVKYVMTKSSPTQPGLRARSQTHASVHGSRVMLFDELLGTIDGNSSQQFEGSHIVGGTDDYESRFRDLQDKINRGSKPVEQIEHVAWRALCDYKAGLQVRDREAPALYSSVRERIATEKPRVFPILRKFAAGRTKETATLEFRSPNRGAIGVLAAILAVDALVYGGVYVAADTLSGGGDGVTSASSLYPNRGSAFGDDSSGNRKEWKLTAPAAVDTSGYWTLGSADSLIISKQPVSYSTPPFRDTGLLTSSLTDGIKKIEPSEPGKNAITVEHTIEKGEDLPWISLRFTDKYLLPVPVLDGDILSSASTLAPDSKQPHEAGVYHTSQGEYFVGITVEDLSDLNGTTISYTVEPVPGGERHLLASEPTQVFSNHDRGHLLSDEISSQDRLTMLHEIPGVGDEYSSVPSPAEVAELVMSHHMYSRSPYKDSGIKSTEAAFSDTDKQALSDREVLMRIGGTAAAARYAICSSAALQTLLITGGHDNQGKPIQLATGYYSNGDDVLSSQEGHMFITDSDGAVIESIPVESIDIDKTSEQKKQIAIRIAKGAGAAAVASAALLFVGSRGRRKIRSFRLARAEKVLNPDLPEHQENLKQSLALYDWMLYAPDRSYSAAELTEVGARGIRVDTDSKISTMPVLSKRAIRRMARQRQASGSELSGEQVAKTVHVLSNAAIRQKFTDASYIPKR